MPKRYWLMKSEPEVYSIDDLAGDGETGWEGVRNYKARNLLRDEIQVGDGVLFYHSNADPPGVAGLAEVVRAGYPDPFQFRKGHKYHDPKATDDKPIWYSVDIRFVERLSRFVPLGELRETTGLEKMMVVKKGARLSVQPVTESEFRIVAALGR